MLSREIGMLHAVAEVCSLPRKCLDSRTKALPRPSVCIGDGVGRCEMAIRPLPTIDGTDSGARRSSGASPPVWSACFPGWTAIRSWTCRRCHVTMRDSMLAFPAYLLAFLRSRHNLGLEILALRQQLAVLKRKHPRPQLKRNDRMFWIALSKVWTQWSNALILVHPDTVVGWHRAGFRLYWRWRSRGGGRKVDGSAFGIVRRMKRDNPCWGAPRIHGELLKLGIIISERTVSRYMARRPPPRGDAAKKWLAFLRNHREAIAALDFFAAAHALLRPALLFLRDRSRATQDSALQCDGASDRQLGNSAVFRETFADSHRYRYVVLDRDTKFSRDALDFLASSGIRAVRTTVRSPWQNGIAERWVSSAPRLFRSCDCTQ